MMLNVDLIVYSWMLKWQVYKPIQPVYLASDVVGCCRAVVMKNKSDAVR